MWMLSIGSGWWPFKALLPLADIRHALLETAIVSKFSNYVKVAVRTSQLCGNMELLTYKPSAIRESTQIVDIAKATLE
jgi:hypothetical protein